jgi:hypothetical protein
LRRPSDETFPIEIQAMATADEERTGENMSTQREEEDRERTVIKIWDVPVLKELELHCVDVQAVNFVVSGPQVPLFPAWEACMQTLLSHTHTQAAGTQTAANSSPFSRSTETAETRDWGNQ